VAEQHAMMTKEHPLAPPVPAGGFPGVRKSVGEPEPFDPPPTAEGFDLDSALSLDSNSGDPYARSGTHRSRVHHSSLMRELD
jgi:hypothetical protein